MPGINLKINEALVLVNKINISNPIAVYYQLEECFGCPPDELKPRATLGDDANAQDQYVIGTQNNFHLELRQLDTGQPPQTTKNWCSFNNVALNSYGQYRIDVSPAKVSDYNHPKDQHKSLGCELETIDSGECLLCPLAILVCILIGIVVLEQVYARFWLSNRQRTAQSGRTERKLSTALESHQVDRQENEATADDGDANTPQDLTPNVPDLDMDTSASRRRSSINQTTGDDNALQEEVSNNAFKRHRIECLDIFRGLTLAGMIFVNYGGAGYALLEHKAWNGITLADFVFPFFIFSMGASVAIAARSMFRHQKSFYAISMKIFRRSCILALLGICLNSKWMDFDQSDGLKELRLTGVLQRFAISYLVIAMMYNIELTINRWIRAQSLTNVPYLSKLIGVLFEALAAINYIAIYVYLTFYFNYDSNCPTGYVGPGGQTEGGQYANCTGGAAAWLDRLLLGTNHLYTDHEVKQIFKTQITHDPEGILGYSTSILLTLIGLQCGKILVGRKTHKQKILALCQWSIALGLASSLVIIIPINKRLWSLTFVTVTATAAFITIILLYVLVDIYSCKQSILVQLLSSAGKNSIFLYVGHSLIYGMLPWWYPIGQPVTHLQLLLRLSWATFVWLLIAHYMAIKKLFIRV